MHSDEWAPSAAYVQIAARQNDTARIVSMTDNPAGFRIVGRAELLTHAEQV
jgi:hypothetical protein